MLYSYIFLTGAVVLILELLGSRLIAPYYGTTVHAWSALITVTLAALAAGYAAGGRLADRKEPLVSLGVMTAAAGLWVFLIPVIKRPVLMAAAPLGTVLGALAGSAILIGVPLVCMGTTVPLCIRLRTERLARMGREMGGVSAVSTMGSVLGALAAGFYLIPNLRIQTILFSSAFLLLILSAACFLSARKPRWGD